MNKPVQRLTQYSTSFRKTQQHSMQATPGSKMRIILFTSLLLSNLSFAITNDDIFSYAQSTYPQLFTGTPVVGHYLQYDYRFYPGTGNYLAVDTANNISLLGPATGNAIRLIGPVSTFTNVITTWKSNQGITPKANPAVDMTKCGSKIGAGAASASALLYLGLACTANVIADFSNLSLVDTVTDHKTCTASYSNGALTVSKDGQSATVLMNGDSQDSVSEYVTGTIESVAVIAPITKAIAGITADVAKISWKPDGTINLIQGGSVAIGGVYKLFTCMVP